MNLSETIESAGASLKESGSDAVPVMRKLQEYLHEITVGDKRLSFLVYVLATIIDDIGFNLTGDFPYDPKNDVEINDYFKGFGCQLVDFGRMLKNNIGSSKIYSVLVEIVYEYMNILKKLEK